MKTINDRGINSARSLFWTSPLAGVVLGALITFLLPLSEAAIKLVLFTGGTQLQQLKHDEDRTVIDGKESIERFALAVKAITPVLDLMKRRQELSSDLIEETVDGRKGRKEHFPIYNELDLIAEEQGQLDVLGKTGDDSIDVTLTQLSGYLEAQAALFTTGLRLVHYSKQSNQEAIARYRNANAMLENYRSVKRSMARLQMARQLLTTSESRRKYVADKTIEEYKDRIKSLRIRFAVAILWISSIIALAIYLGSKLLMFRSLVD